MSTIAVTAITQVSVVETETGDFVDPNNATVTYNQLSETEELTASTTVPVTKHAAFDKALVAGVATIDLTALPGKNADEVVNGTGLKVQEVKFKNKATNANSITITFGAANPYLLFGSGWKIILLPGQSIQASLKDASPDVAGGARTIDLAGTASQSLQCHFVLG